MSVGVGKSQLESTRNSANIEGNYIRHTGSLKKKFG